MKAVQIVSPNNLQVIDVEKPSIDEKNNVMIKMTAAGICGSDVGIYHGTNAAGNLPTYHRSRNGRTCRRGWKQRKDFKGR